MKARATVEIAKMVLVGKLNKDIVLRLNQHGQPAVGLCGDDGSLFRVKKQLVPDGGGGTHDLGFVGTIVWLYGWMLRRSAVAR